MGADLSRNTFLRTAGFLKLASPGSPGSSIPTATQVQAWEKFRFIDQGNCKYAVQTVSGFFVGIFNTAQGGALLTTRRTEITENEKFQLVMYGLASPLVLQ